ncbi:hypothetical protein Plim_1846 [Planctopirus limnophila DSM 3776]|uniref:Uncharacterized protein n=3 Tax=Planctopirus TaxID=1649480 RepID=D5SYE8_PLAL2|nr:MULTISPECIES: hypothetical protein [Planctopirus]ADG67676.1 hypothetical protein Plim_1846 [Planctopirus limnophila DSM 3776]ODA32703.1 hypothetical protein A6X21_20365 [Planctopirus hydrillae]QDV30757.1 hypothetical protein Spb1_26910 [Planctopirus ephydatiae]
MARDFDLDDLEEETLGYGEEGEELEGEFEHIDFEALGIDPARPTTAKPGSEDKVLMLAARYSAGVPLWNTDDCYDHGPAEMLARLARGAKA